MMLKWGGWPSEMVDAGGVRTQSVQGCSLTVFIEVSGRSVNSMTSSLSLYLAGE